MIISIHKDSPYYSKSAMLYEVFCNDEKVNYCCKANVYDGICWFYNIDKNGKFVFIDNDISISKMYGNIKIRKHQP